VEALEIMDLSFYNGKKVFITGHTGFKGTWMCRMLLNAGADVTGYALEPPTEPATFDILNLSKDMNSIIGDIRNLDRLSSSVNQVNPEIVIHMAAQPIVRDSYKNPVYTFETNVMGTVNILEAVRQNGKVKSFVNVTTDKVYKNNEWDWGYRENDRLGGYDPYSNSKSCSELVAESYRNSFFYDKKLHPAISTARAGNVIGGGDFAKDRIIPDCVRAAFKNEVIIVRNPYSTRPYQHVLEPVSGYLKLAMLQYEDPVKYEGSYNFGPDDADCITTGAITDLFCTHWGEVSWKNVSENGPHEANFLKLDCSRSKNILKWYPIWSISQAVAAIVEWSKCFALGGDVAAVTDRQIDEFLNCGRKSDV
jgi:CDP-glucose 4,6-dehydratase